MLRKIAETVADDQGAGAVGPALGAAAHRLIGFELQFGPFAVAQLRLMAEMRALMVAAATGTGGLVGSLGRSLMRPPVGLRSKVIGP